MSDVASRKLMLTAEEVAELLGIGRTKVYELMATRRLGSVKIGTCRRVTVEQLRAYVRDLAEAS